MDREPKIEKGLPPQKEEGAEHKEGGETLLADLIDLPRVEIVREDESGYTIKFGDEEIEIIKSDETYFEAGTQKSTVSGLSLKPALAFNIGGIFHDKDVPKEFTEVMIFHEIREREYKEVGFEDAHYRAINDEILYALKYLSADTQKTYFQFAKERREIARLEEEKTEKKKTEQQAADRKDEEKEKENLKKIREEIRQRSIEDRARKSLELPDKLSPEQSREAKEFSRYISDYLSANQMRLSLGLEKGKLKIIRFAQEKLEKIPQELREGDVYKIFKSKILDEIESMCSKGKLDETDQYKIHYEVKLSKLEMEEFRAKLKVFHEFIRKY